MSFVFVCPKSVTGRAWPTVKPDLDKLVRAVFDALTAAHVWRDDALCCRYTTEKSYGPAPGCHVELYRLDDEAAPQ